MVNVLLRSIQLILALGINYILLHFVVSVDATIIAETLIYSTFFIQVIFGVLGTYILNRLRNSNEEMIMHNPESFYVFVVILGFISVFFCLILPKNSIFLIAAIVSCQGGFQLINSHFSVKKSIKISLLFALFVYVLFFTYLLMASSNMSINSTFWCLGWATANLIPAIVILYKYDTFRDYKFAESIQFFQQKNLVVHSLGHLSAITVAWYAFLHTRTFYEAFNAMNYSELLQVGIFISLLVGAIEVFFNTVFLTKVFRSPNNSLEFKQYLDNFCFLLFISNLFLLLLYFPLSRYYFPSDFLNIPLVFSILLATENLKLYFNLAINNAARCFDYKFVLKSSVPLVFLFSLLIFSSNASQALLLISATTGVLLLIGIIEDFLSIPAAILLALCNLNAIVIFFLNDSNIFFVGSIIYFFSSVLISAHFFSKFNIRHAIKEFLHYD